MPLISEYCKAPLLAVKPCCALPLTLHPMGWWCWRATAASWPSMPTFWRLWRFPPDMLRRLNVDEMRLHTATQMLDRDGYLRSLAQLRLVQQPQFLEPLALRDGRYFERHVSPLAAIDGLPQAAGGIIVRWRDVTLRVQAERRQRELTALLDMALAGADLAYWEVDVQSGEVHSHNDRWHAILGYAPGDLADNFSAWDQLVHPDDAAARLDAWHAHLEGRAPRYEAEFRMRHKAGHWVWLQARGLAVQRAPDGRAVRLVGTRQDITAAKQVQLGLHALAHTDELTGIHNRRRFVQRAEEELERARRYGLPVALLMMDLDHFKAINDRWGHAAGDEVLRSFANTARTVMRQSDVFGRIGGEEFAALLPHTTLAGAGIIGERLLEQVRQQPARWSAATLPYTASVGVSVATEGSTVQALMGAADAALYRAKALGRDRLVVADLQPPQ